MTLFLAEVEKELPLSNEPNLAGRLFARPPAWRSEARAVCSSIRAIVQAADGRQVLRRVWRFCLDGTPGNSGVFAQFVTS
jgi:hypothetical protein